MKSKVKILLVIISLSLTLGLMSNTYSRYVADTTSDLNMQFAPWKILVNESDILNEKDTSIALTPIMDENINIADNMIAPTSKGYFDIEIDPTNTATAFNYEISLNILNENIPDILINKYAILDSNYQEGDEVQSKIINDSIVSGEVSLEDNIIKPFTIRVYFEWYDGEDNLMNDEADTLIANTEENLQIEANIKFTQKI